MDGGAPADPRLAYFVSSYRGGGQLARLVSLLRAADPAGAVVVHHNAEASAIDVAAYRRLGVHVLLADRPVRWGDASLEQCRWRVLRWIRAHLDVDAVVLLSEQDYPVAPLSDLRAHLRGWDGVLSGEPAARIADPAVRDEAVRRYGYRYVALPRLGLAARLPAPARRAVDLAAAAASTAVNRSQPWVRCYRFHPDLELPVKVGLRRPARGYRPGFPPWYADSWYALSVRAVDRVLAFLDNEPAYARYVEGTIVPTESATQSVVLNDPTLRIRRATLHHLRFSRPETGRPDVLTAADLPEILASGAWFARKFDADDPVLDTLDARVLGRGALTPGR